MAIIIANFFFVIFDENDVLYILVEFESDRMSPRDSAENGLNDAHGLNWKIFVHSEFRFEIYDKNYLMKKNFMTLRPFWNFRDPTCSVPNYTLNILCYKDNKFFIQNTGFQPIKVDLVEPLHLQPTPDQNDLPVPVFLT